MISGGVVVGLGDAIAQRISPHFKQFDKDRFLSMITYGFLISGGIGHLWFRGLDKYFGNSMTITNSIKKVCADQFIIAPPEIVFFLWWSYYTSQSTHSFTDLLKATLPGLLVQNYAIWIPSQFANFYYIPEQHRVLFMCAICVVWFAILSFTSHEFKN
jgi:protein Mpv17